MRELERYKASVLALIVSNLVPLFGVIFLSWDTFEIVGLYWVENVIIGAINILKIATCRPNLAELEPTEPGVQRAARRSRKGTRAPARELPASKLFFIPLFTFHYGLFCAVHGVLVVAFFAPETSGIGPLSGLQAFPQVISERHLWWGVLALAASHVYSYLVNYLGRGEYRQTVVPTLMLQPYARVVVLHLAIIFGVWVVGLLGSTAGVLVILVVGKTVIDLALHLAERRRNEGGTTTKANGRVLAEVPID